MLTGLAFMLIVYAANRKSIHKKIARDKHTQEESMVGVMKIIFLMVTPIIFNTFVYNASSYLDSKIFSDILNMKGIVAKVVSGQWGEYSNYYITLINIPLALSSATSSAMMPEIATRFIKNEYKEANEKINEGIQLTMFLVYPGSSWFGCAGRFQSQNVLFTIQWNTVGTAAFSRFHNGYFLRTVYDYERSVAGNR